MRPEEDAVADDDILERIRGLVDEEHAIRSSGEPEDTERLNRLEDMLDQCWDLLRQRRAHREFGQDEGEAAVRDAGTVEHYRQ